MKSAVFLVTQHENKTSSLHMIGFVIFHHESIKKKVERNVNVETKPDVTQSDKSEARVDTSILLSAAVINDG